jgi:hypothetical protein
MAPLEEQLLENVIDSLDRAFDRRCGAVDVHAIILATSAALPSSKFTEVAAPALCALEQVVKSQASDGEQWMAILSATDDLRAYIASVLPVP